MNTWAPPRKRSVGLLFQIEALEIVLYKNSLKFLWPANNYGSWHNLCSFRIDPKRYWFFRESKLRDWSETQRRLTMNPGTHYSVENQFFGRSTEAGTEFRLCPQYYKSWKKYFKRSFTGLSDEIIFKKI